jgi:hypothetical protein
MAMALAMPSRLWLGGVFGPQRDLVMIASLVQMVRRCARTLAMLVCVDPLARYVTACLCVLRQPVRTGRHGRPRLVLKPGLLLGQGITRYVQRRVVSVERQVVRGTEAAIAAVLVATYSGTGINTADIERLNATLRVAGAPGVSGARPRPQQGRRGRGDVAGGLCLPLLLVARQPPKQWLPG